MPLLSAPKHLSHIHEIPNEIWTEIFLLASLIRNNHETKFSQSEAPISVSQTCSRWREIATNTPRLWSSISVEADGKSENPKTYPDLPLISLWLKRSKKAPLFISLNLSWVSSPIPPSLQASLSQIFSTTLRWETATLDFYKLKNDYIFEILSWMQEAPLLQSFTLVLEPTDVANLPTVIWTKSPQLRKLSLRFNSNLVDSGWRSHIPYEQLTSLYIGGSQTREHITQLDAIIRIFKHGKNLVTCCIEYVEKPNSVVHAMTGPPPTLHHLRHLYLCLSMDGYDSRDTTNSLTDVLIYLTAPSLESLTLVYAEPCWKQEPYTAFIQRSSCSLRSLHFRQTPMCSRDVLECLRLSPTLKRFHITYFNFRRCFLDAEFGRQMAAWDSTTKQIDICPELEWFSVDNFVTIRPAEILLLAKMMKIRLSPPDRPDHSKGAFTFAMASSHNIADPHYPVRRPRSKPINDLQAIGLRIVCNDDMLKPTTLWKTYHSS